MYKCTRTRVYICTVLFMYTQSSSYTDVCFTKCMNPKGACLCTDKHTGPCYQGKIMCVYMSVHPHMQSRVHTPACVHEGATQMHTMGDVHTHTGPSATPRPPSPLAPTCTALCKASKKVLLFCPLPSLCRGWGASHHETRASQP